MAVDWHAFARGRGGVAARVGSARPGVAEAVATSQRAGVRVIMITGDHAGTARAIAVRLGIAGPDATVLTGTDLAAWTTANCAGGCGRSRSSPG